MPKGIPNKKPGENGEQISKMEAMRRAIKAKGGEAKPLELQGFIKSEFNLDMTTDMISNYKSTVLKALAEQNGASAPKAPAKAAVTAAPKAKTAGEFSLDELEAVKALADKIGANKVQQLAKALAK